MNANPPLAVIDTESAPLKSTRPEPARFSTVPPMTYVFVAQLTTTLVTAPAPTVPVPPLTLHVWTGAVGFV